MQPKISVVMPVYNTEQFVAEAIQSILDQTFTAFEFIIVDDGCTDKSWEIISAFAKKDPRIKALQNDGNKGIAYTRKKLIGLTSTPYIASMDSDDISMPERLALGYAFMESHPDCAVVSGNTIIIDEQGDKIGYRTYSDNIRFRILKKSPIAQPASMFRKEVYEMVGGYDDYWNYGEDYDLWCKIYSKGYHIKNLNKPLLQLRMRTGQTKSSHLKQTLKNTIEIQKHAIKQYQIKQTLSDRIYILFEQVLLLLPAQLILQLFTFFEYQGKKN